MTASDSPGGGAAGLRERKLEATVIMMAAVIVIFAGLRTASDIVVPFLVAVFVATLAGPAVFWLTRHRVPKVLAILIVLLLVLGGLTLILTVVVMTLQDINANLPVYQAQFETQFEAVTRGIEEIVGRTGLEINYTEVLGEFNLRSVFIIARDTLLQAGSLVTRSLLITLIVLFMLLEASQLPAKLARAFDHPTEVAWASFREFAVAVQKYLAIKTATSLATGLCACAWVWILDVDFPLFWGLIAFLFNYVPNVGSIIAAAPAVMLSILQHGPSTGLAVVAGYLVINIVIGSLIEPQYMGEGVGLSPLVVFGSLVFWGWMFGAVGILFSTPLTISLRIALGHYSETKWLAVLIGSAKG